jgi:hypothetical protein
MVFAARLVLSHLCRGFFLGLFQRLVVFLWHCRGARGRNDARAGCTSHVNVIVELVFELVFELQVVGRARRARCTCAGLFRSSDKGRNRPSPLSRRLLAFPVSEHVSGPVVLAKSWNANVIGGLRSIQLRARQSTL